MIIHGYEVAAVFVELTIKINILFFIGTEGICSNTETDGLVQTGSIPLKKDFNRAQMTDWLI